MIQFSSKNFMFKKTVNRMASKNYIQDPWPLVYVLDSDDNMVGCYCSYSQDLEDAVSNDGVFLVLAFMEYNDFKRAKEIRFGDDCPDEYLEEFIVTTGNHRNIFSVPCWQCPDYSSPELFGLKIKKVGDEYEMTYGLHYKEYYEILFDRGYEDIEIVYADELEIAAEIDKKPPRFIPFNRNDDEKDKYSVNNLFNPTLIRFMHDGLSFKADL